ncbi:MAG: DUF2336 domain-containing protein [Caulobacteraceae bacterium]
MRGVTPDERAVAAHKLCRRIEEGALPPGERRAADEIVRVMAADPAELVRRTLSVTLRASAMMPRDVALKLARDAEAVALPVLSFSPVLTDADMVEIVRAAGPARQIAVASRTVLSDAVTTALAEHGAEAAVRVACANDRRGVSPPQACSGRSRDSPTPRRCSPPWPTARPCRCRVAERLVNMVGDQVRDHLVDHHALSPETALQVAVGTRERATADLVDQAGMTADVERFVARLNEEGRLTPSLLLRALAHGHMTFFEWGIAERARAPHHRAWMMIHDAGPLALRAIYERAGLPVRLFEAFRAGVDTFHSLQKDGRPGARERFQERSAAAVPDPPDGRAQGRRRLPAGPAGSRGQAAKARGKPATAGGAVAPTSGSRGSGSRGSRPAGRRPDQSSDLMSPRTTALIASDVRVDQVEGSRRPGQRVLHQAGTGSRRYG